MDEDFFNLTSRGLFTRAPCFTRSNACTPPPIPTLHLYRHISLWLLDTSQPHIPWNWTSLHQYGCFYAHLPMMHCHLGLDPFGVWLGTVISRALLALYPLLSRFLSHWATTTSCTSPPFWSKFMGSRTLLFYFLLDHIFHMTRTWPKSTSPWCTLHCCIVFVIRRTSL